MSTTLWSTDRGNWSISNNNTTVTHFGTNNKATAKIAAVYATNPIPAGSRTYVAFAATGAVDEDALGVGVGIKAGGGIKPSQSLSFGYNGDVNSSGRLLVDPIQPDGKRAGNNPKALVVWGNNTTPGNGALTYIVVAVDSAKHLATISYAVPSTGVHKVVGTFGVPGGTLYPYVEGWNYRGNPSVTILPGAANGGYAGIVPAGFTALDKTGSGGAPPPTGGGVPPPPSKGGDIVTVNRPAKLSLGNVTFTGHETDASQPVYLVWRTHGVPVMGEGDIVRAKVAANGDFSAVVPIDHPGTSSTLYAGTGGPLTAQWSATPMTFIAAAQGPVTAATTDVISVNRPPHLTAGMQTLQGSETDPAQSVFLAWRTHGTPTLSDGGWVKAVVNPRNGSFTASIDVDRAGVSSTLFAHAGNGPITAVWSATPS